jgi:hypothetical protein
VRALVFLVAAMAVIGCEDEEVATTSAPPRPTATATGAATGKARDDCRDNCEQTNILAGGGDDALRACRDRCDARYGAAARPHEVPSRITVAKPAHAPPLVQPIAR